MNKGLLSETLSKGSFRNISFGIILRNSLVLLASAFASFYLITYIDIVCELNSGIASNLIKAFPVAFLFWALYQYLFFSSNNVLRTAFKYRYLIGLTLFLICLVFQVNTSSIGVWDANLPNSSDSSLLWGKPQKIRSDEWAINLPFYLAQEQAGYPAINEIIRAAQTSVTLLPSLPAYSIIDIFKPTFWGYLLFGTSIGLAWSCWLRIIGLFLITIDFFMILTKNKWLSTAAAVVILFSPYTQWWFAMDVLLYGESIIVLLYYFLNTHRKAIRLIIGILIPWVAGCYLFIAYPGWIVPCFFIFLIVGIYIIIQFARKAQSNECDYLKLRFTDFIPLVLCLILFIGSIFFIFQDASLAVEGMLNTIYPGSRVYTGGDGGYLLFDWIPSIFYPICPEGTVFANVCERSAYFTLFPLGLVLAVIVSIKKRDIFTICLLILQLIFLFFLIVGFPEWLAKITMLSSSVRNRMLMPIGLLDTILLFLSIKNLCADSEKKLFILQKGNIWMSIFVTLCLILSIGFCILMNSSNPAFWTKGMIILLFVACLIVFLTILVFLHSSTKDAFKCTLIAFSALLITSGICVNPIERGVGVLTNNDVYKEIETIADENPNDVWIAEGSFVYSNLCVAAGAPTLTSTNTYPNVHAWNELDPDGIFEEVYMRYANIDSSVITEEERDQGKELFELQAVDYMRLNITPAELEELNVRYLLTVQEHESTDELEFVELARFEEMPIQLIIYELNYE